MSNPDWLTNPSIWPTPPPSLIGVAQLQLRRYNEMNALTRHKHADLIVERARQDASGETAAGWWGWGCRGTPSGEWAWTGTATPVFRDPSEYRYTMTDKHPQYVPPKPKLKLKLIDMSRMPKGSMVAISGMPTSRREVYGLNSFGRLLLVDKEAKVSVFDLCYIRIIKQKDFTYWGGGACPVPEGVVVECVMRDKTKGADVGHAFYWAHETARGDFADEIIGYRITGVADGWTDDPELAK